MATSVERQNGNFGADGCWARKWFWGLAWVALAVVATAPGCGGGPAQPLPRAGAFASDYPAWFELANGRVNLAGGNWLLSRTLLSIDTRVGTQVVSASWNSATKAWRWSFDMTHDGATFTDELGTEVSLAVADGATLEGTTWRRVDAARVSTRGGLVHTFSSSDGRLSYVHWKGAPWPRLIFQRVEGGAAIGGVVQCIAEAVCEPVYDIERNAQGQPNALVDRAGRRAEFAYAAGALIRVASPADVAAGRTGEQYEYRNTNLSSVTTGDGQRSEMTWSGGRLQRFRRIREPAAGAGPEWQFQYGRVAGNNETRVVRPSGSVTRLVYDDARRALEREDAPGEIRSWVWAGGRPTSMTDADGAATHLVWMADELLQRSDPTGNITTFSYAPEAIQPSRPRETAVASVHDSLGLVREHTYDGFGRLATSKSGAGDTTTWVWNADGSLARIAGPLGRSVSYSQYGEHGHPEVVDRAGWVAQRTYDAVGNLVRADVPDAGSGGVMERIWNDERMLIGMTLIDQPGSGAATLHPLTIVRRSDGQPVSVARPGGGETHWVYDDMGREVLRRERVTAPGASAPVWHDTLTEWSDEGIPISQARPNGMRVDWEVDAGNRVVRERRSRGGVVESDVLSTFANGQLVLLEEPSAGFSESRTYDAAGRMTVQVHADGSTSHVGYDSRSRPVKRRFADASGTSFLEVEFDYDLADRLIRIGQPATDLVQWVWAAGAASEVHHANGVVEKATVASGLMQTREWTRPSGPVAVMGAGYQADGWRSLEITAVVAPEAPSYTFQNWGLTVGDGPERRLTYEIDASEGTGVSRTYAFDPLSNLTQRTEEPAGPIDFGFNAEGNRLEGAYQGGAQTAIWRWDEAGFATTRGSAALTWDTRGQLTVLTQGGAIRARFGFDAMGRRVSRTIDGTTTSWSHGGAIEVDASGEPVAADLGPVRIALDGDHRYRHTDMRGNVFLETDSAGQVVSSVQYGAFGARGRTGSVAEHAFDFARGYVLPAEAGLDALQIVGDRVYDPYAGRFLAPDPEGHMINLHAYTLGNPIEFWDPTGRTFESVDWGYTSAWLKAAGATLGAVAVCGTALAEPSPFGEVACAGIAVTATGYVIDAVNYEAEQIGGVGVPVVIPTFPSLPLPTVFIPRVTIWDPPFPPLSKGGNGGGWERDQFLEW